MSKRIFIAIFLSILVFQTGAVIAADPITYAPLEPLPRIVEGDTSQLEGYLTFVFRFALIAAAFLAVAQIVRAGVYRIASGSSETLIGKSNELIKQAVYGLILALLSWLILFTINPTLTNIKLDIPDITTIVDTTSLPSDDPYSPYNQPNDPNSVYTHEEAKQKLDLADITIKSSGGCSNKAQGNCTSLEGIRKDTIERLIELKTACK
ncbi:MAG TPA: hypothetical protein VJJ73_00515, partial [Candidatus Paceibacterota bacterium]